MDGPSDEIDLEAFLPRGFEHRNSEDDLWDLALALESGDEDGAIRKLTDRWTQEDEKNREIARERKKQQFRDRQLTYIARSLDEQKNARIKAEKKFLNVKDVAELLGKSEKTIRRWAERENFPLPVIKKPNKSQNTWSFDREEVLSWFELYQRK